MISAVGTLQQLVTLALGIGALVLQVWALVDVLRQRPEAFPAAGKWSKQLWTIILAVAAAIGFVSLWAPLNFLNVIAVVAAAVYLVDVRPAVRGMGRRGGSSGPYGW